MSAGEEAPDLDRGLKAAFLRKGQVAGPASVLAAIEQITGAEAPRVSLKESPSADGSSPVMKAGAAVKGLVPQGRANYQLQGEIARGGMGVILKGHDLDLGRDVALKILREDLSKRPEIVQRFVEEAQIGGQLQHPGIVPVYELGLMADQRPYFAMKLVKGRTLAALLAERQGEKGGERRKLLDVFEAVCQTMAYAHSKGVVHRDLKPANLLIGAFGEVQVVDWGLAKVLKAGGVHDEKRSRSSRPSNVSVIATVRSAPGSAGSDSLSGSVLGTPAYMPPEQARGDVEKLDERSDVFSLGAILCEILTGAPPYVGEAEATLEQAANGRLEGALQRIDGCHADPDLVDLVKSCLVPAQSARPRSAEVLAERIHAYLASVEERARAAQIHAAEAKVRARSTALLAAAGIALVLLGGGGWTWLQQQRAARVRATETSVSAALQDATLARGKQDWPAALAALEHARARLEGGDASEDLRAQVSALGTEIDRESTAAGRATQVAAENAQLLTALEELRPPEGAEHYPAGWKPLDRDYRDLLESSGVDVDAMSPAEAARVLGERGISVELASEIDAWADVRGRAKDDDGAAALTAIADALDPEPLRRELRSARVRKDAATLSRIAKEADATTLPAPTLRLLARSLELAGESEAAIALLRAVRLEHPQEFLLAMELGRALASARPPNGKEAAANFAAARALRPESVEAVHELARTLPPNYFRPTEAVDLLQSTLEQRPDDAHLLVHLGLALSQLGRKDEGLASLHRALELDPNDALAHELLGSALDDADRSDEAIATFRRSVELTPEHAGRQCSLGAVLARAGRLDEALGHFRRAIELDPTLVVAHTNEARALWQLGRREEAIASCRRVTELDPGSGAAHRTLGDLLSALGRHEEAIASCRRAVELDPTLALAHQSLGLALHASGREEEALPSLRRADELDPKLVMAQVNVAVVLNALGRHEEALEQLRRAVALHPDYAPAHASLGAQLSNMDQFEVALSSFRRALELDPTSTMALVNYGITLGKLGRNEEAIASFRRAVEVDPRLLTAHSMLAWVLATIEAEDLRDATAAVDHARRAIALEPQGAAPALVANDLENLGVALYVNDQFEEARAALVRAAAIGGEGGGPNSRSLFLALCLHRLGDDAEARRWFDRAAPGFAQLLENGPELRRFVDEARAALGDPSVR